LPFKCNLQRYIAAAPGQLPGCAVGAGGGDTAAATGAGASGRRYPGATVVSSALVVCEIPPWSGAGLSGAAPVKSS
jgi:hypothetical protein